VTPRLLFFSNLFPTAAEPYRGLDNATLLHALAPHFDIRVLSPRPTLPWNFREFSARPEDAAFQPRWLPAAYLPKIGGSSNHLLMANSLRPAFEQTLRDFDPNIILSSWVFPDSCAALQLADGRLPVVSIAQGTDVHQYIRMTARRGVILKYLPRASAVVTRSRELSLLLAAAGFPSAKLHTIYNGVSHETFQPRDQAQARRDSALPTDARIILFVGNFYDVKDPLLLIRAVAQIESVVLVMAGGGPLKDRALLLSNSERLRERLHSALANLKTDSKDIGQIPASRIIFAGRKTPPEIARLMNAADLLAIPSKNEGVPNVLIEALASGLPVVASRVGGIPEVLDHDSLGTLFPAGDLPALVAALRRQLAAPRDPAAIRRHASRFTWDAAAAQYREILLAALQ
jgi:glycosyltransferase involved in cell wall biosynthesis